MKIQEVKAPQQWLKLINGDYDVCFAPLTVTALSTDLKSGNVLTAVSGEVGVLAQDAKKGETVVRCMVRGNPSVLDKKQLIGLTSELEAALKKADLLCK
ncbi:TPA: hypothetical protein ACX6QM_002583 [Photobacterium damselae]